MNFDYTVLQSSPQGFLNSVFLDWMIIAGILILLSAGVAGIIYIVGSLLANDKIKTWAKIEVVEVAYSMVLIVLTISFLGTIDVVAQSIASTDQFSGIVCSSTFSQNPYYAGVPCHIRLGMHYLSSLFNEGRDLGYQIYKIYIFTSAFAEMTINLELVTEQTGVFAYNPIKGFFAIGNVIKSITFDYLIKIMTIIKFQEVFLRFIALALFPVIFLIGIVLRSFFFTRKLGGLLMALSLALYFIYPMFYVLGGFFFNEFKLKAVTYSCSIGKCDEYPYNSALNALYINMDGFPTLDGTGLDEAAFKKERDNYQNNPGYATAYMNNLGTNPSTPGAYKLPNMCAVIDDATADAKTAIVQNKSRDLVDTLKSTNMWNRIVFLGDLANPSAPGVMSSGGYIDSASKLTFFSLFFSFLGVMATIAATKSLSGLFGGDLEIAGLTHLV